MEKLLRRAVLTLCGTTRQRKPVGAVLTIYSNDEGDKVVVYAIGSLQRHRKAREYPMRSHIED